MVGSAPVEPLRPKSTPARLCAKNPFDHKRPNPRDLRSRDSLQDRYSQPPCGQDRDPAGQLPTPLADLIGMGLVVVAIL